MAEYIERETALEIVKITSGDYLTAWHKIAHMKASDVVPAVHGCWIKDREWYETVCAQSTSYHCSVCGRKAGYKQVRLYDYCPKCGAKMDANK